MSRNELAGLNPGNFVSEKNLRDGSKLEEHSDGRPVLRPDRQLKCDRKHRVFMELGLGVVTVQQCY